MRYDVAVILPLILAVADILLWWLFTWAPGNIDAFSSEPLLNVATFTLALLVMLWTLMEVLQLAGSMRARDEAEE